MVKNDIYYKGISAYLGNGITDLFQLNLRYTGFLTNNHEMLD